MESVWSVSKLSTESVGSRYELAANCVHTGRHRRDSTRQLSRVGVGGVYWAVCSVDARHFTVNFDLFNLLSLFCGLL